LRDFRKDGGSRVGKKAKPVVVTVKRRIKVYVRGIQWEGVVGERDYYWRHLKNLEV